MINSIPCLLMFAFAAMAVPPSAQADAVTEWNAALQAITARVPPASDSVAEEAAPLVALAMYDAIVAVDGGYRPYLGRLNASPGASADAAAHAAAHAVLVELFPADRERLDQTYNDGLARLPDDTGRMTGIAVGLEAARRITRHRKPVPVATTTSYRPAAQPGQFVPPQLPAREWQSRLTPFVLRDPDRFRSPGPPPLASDEYADDYAEVLAVGERHSRSRTKEQSAVARFWHSADLRQVLQQVLARPDRTLAMNARLLALYATAQFDAGIVLAREKYRHDFWRPVTAIRNGDVDGNSSTVRAETWEPLLATPSHPDYPCGHCLVSSMAAVLLAADAGPAPANGVVATSGTPSGAETRRFDSYERMAEEISDSRVWGGVHFRRGAIDGAQLGREMAHYILSNAFQPIPAARTSAQ